MQRTRLVSRAVAAALLGAGLLTVPRARAQVPPPTAALVSLGAYAVFALSEVTLRGDVDVQPGDVGVNSPSGSATLMARSHVAGTVVAQTIRLGRRAKGGQLFCTQLEPTDATAAPCQSMTLPLIDPATLPPLQVAPGHSDLRLPPRAIQEHLPPGAYGVVKVGALARLSLVGGDYAFRRLDLERGAELLCEAACHIAVSERVVVGETARLGAVPPLDALSVRVDVNGRGRVAAFRSLRRSVIDATVYAPNGGIVLGMSGRYTGAFVADRVFVYQRAHITGQSALP